MDLVVTAAVSQLYRGSPDPMSATQGQAKDGAVRRRVRNGALGLGLLALAFYLGFIVLLVSRSHH
jgi:hypothetical protein